MICNDYTPNGVVVVVVVVATVVATKVLVVIANENMLILFHMIFKNTTFCELKKFCHDFY